jgi:hypothetical protein
VKSYNVTRTYKVDLDPAAIADLEDADNNLLAELIDACTRAADVGNLSGTMDLVTADDLSPYWELDADSTMYTIDKSVEYEVVETDYDYSEWQD